MSSSPKVAPFLRENNIEKRCMICSDDEVREWLRGCIVETKKVGAKRPSAGMVHREIKTNFPGRHPRSENSTRNHLREHEPEWFRWSDEAETLS